MAQQATTKTLDQAEETRSFPKGKVELWKLGTVEAGRVR
jgi:hypothetical protein